MQRCIKHAVRDIRERLSILAVFPDGYRVAINLYRNYSYPDFGKQDSEWLTEHAHLLSVAVMRHMQVVRSPGFEESTGSDLIATLSGSERQVLSCVMAGMTTKEAATELGISYSTVLTYRYRAFQHLGIRTKRELLALVSEGRATYDSS